MDRYKTDICMIEPDADQRNLLIRRLHGDPNTILQATNAEIGLELIRRHRPYVVICALRLPGMSGLELCRQIRTDTILNSTYIIILTGCDDRQEKNRVLNAGADDYLTKPYDDEEIAARLRNGLRLARLQERLKQAALTDGLTGLWNHTHFRNILDREFARTRRYGGIISLLMLDIDHFKAVNDTYGHEVGNLVLKGISSHLLNMMRDTDVVARYGGEEFAIVCPETNFDQAAELAERIRTTIPEQVRLGDYPRLTVTVSIGVSATSDTTITSASNLINHADQALYQGKRSGRNRVIRSDQALPTTEVGIELAQFERLQKQVVSLSMQSKELCLQSVWALVQALEARDPYTAWHSRNTTFYCNALAEAAKWPPALRDTVANAAMLHDLGKIGIPDRILQNPNPLTPEEAAILRQVPLLTCRILEPLRVFETETLIIRHLRERYDGTGHPFGLSGHTIPLGARLLAVAEAFDALTSDRAHRPRHSLDQALDLISADAGQQFDPQFTQLLSRVATDRHQAWTARIQNSLSDLAQAIIPGICLTAAPANL